MFRAAPRLIARSALPRSIAPTRRCISTAPPTQKSRSWKSLVARIGVAGTIIYYYNTTDVFAEEPMHSVQALPETETESEHLPTIESIAAERQKRKAVQAQLDAQAQKEAQSRQHNAPPADGAEGGIEGLEAEADQQGAFNPETGEINWDCPCLGGMATGPCGEQFKAAFSCFVYSEEEPKGMDCIDKFKDMQNCFREYPEVYGSELEGDGADEDDDLPTESTPAADYSDSTPAAAYSDSTPATASSDTTPPPSRSATSTSESSSSRTKSRPETGNADQGKLSSEPSSIPKSNEGRRELDLVPNSYKPDSAVETERSATQIKNSESVSESESLVPKAAHDAGDANTARLERK